MAQLPARRLLVLKRRDSVALAVTRSAEMSKCEAKEFLEAVSICVLVTLGTTMLIVPVNLYSVTVVPLVVPPVVVPLVVFPPETLVAPPVPPVQTPTPLGTEHLPQVSKHIPPSYIALVPA